MASLAGAFTNTNAALSSGGSACGDRAGKVLTLYVLLVVGLVLPLGVQYTSEWRMKSQYLRALGHGSAVEASPRVILVVWLVLCLLCWLAAQALPLPALACG